MLYVNRKKTLLSLCSFLMIGTSLVHAQSRILQGKVTSSDDNRPVGGASISVLGKNTHTVSNDSGYFRIPAMANDSIVINSVGFEMQKLSAAPDDSLFVHLLILNSTLQDVVVVGYGTQKRSDVTGSVVSIKSDDIKSLPVPDAGQAMQGKASGVQIINSGAPGSNVTIRVRGVGTINNSDPLLVIDGVPTDIPLNTLNPSDIATIDILKDASAAAIYGSRGANGVVLITTKKGTSKSSINANYYYGSQQATHMVKLLNASQFASLHNEMMKNNGQAQYPDFADPTALGSGTDWLGSMFHTAPIQNGSISFSGGSPKSTYYISGSVLDQQGIVINTSYRRYTVQFNSTSNVLSWLRLGSNLTLNHDVKKNGDYNILNAMEALPTQEIYNADGSYTPTTMGDITNPIGKAKINQNTTNGYNILGNIFLEMTLAKDLKFKSTGGVQYVNWDTRNWSPKYNFQPNPQQYSYLGESYNKSLTWLWDNVLTYDHYFSNHHLTALVGSSAQTNRYDYMNGSVQGFASDAANQLDNGNMPQLSKVGGSGNEWALLSYMARVNYDFAGRYLLTATVRRDGSSRFGSNNKYGTFPSGSFAWRISKENFWKDNDWVNDLKLRVGYGVTGNQNIGNYAFASTYTTGNYSFNGTNVSTVVPNVLPNPNVKWERVAQANVGLDATIIKNRINITLDGYLKNTNGMLVPMVVPVTSGYSDINVPYINLGKVRNSGWELTINSTNIDATDFKWSTNFNISYNKNKILALNDTIPMYTGSIGLNQYLAIQQVGKPINTFYGYVTNGIFQTQQEIDNYAVQVPGSDPNNRTSPGDIKFRDLNNDGVINDADRTYLGSPNPTFIFGMTNNFSYKNFDLSIFLQGVSGNKVFNANRIYMEGMSVLVNQDTYTLDRWTGTGTSNSMPRAVYNDPNQNTRVSDRFIEDGSYLRIKNLAFGYTFPRKWTDKAKISAARIYISCQNLATFTKYKGFDPEVSSNGIDLNTYPVTRTLSAGINLTL